MDETLLRLRAFLSYCQKTGHFTWAISPGGNKWRAQIGISGRQTTVGEYHSKADAIAAYLAAAQMRFGDCFSSRPKLEKN